MLRTNAALHLKGTHALSRLDATLHDFIQTYLETEYGPRFTRSASFSLNQFRFVSDEKQGERYCMRCVVQVRVQDHPEDIATLGLTFTVVNETGMRAGEIKC